MMGSAMVIPSAGIFSSSDILHAVKDSIQRRIELSEEEVLLVSFCVSQYGQLALVKTLSFLWFVDVEDSWASMTLFLLSSSSSKLPGNLFLNSLHRGCSLTFIWV
jgi:hypothetical protein